MVTSVDGRLTRLNTLSSPFPEGGTPGNVNQSINQPAGRSQAYLTSLEGQSISGPVPYEPYGYVQQWNLNVERQLGSSASARIAYLGSKGTHLPLSTPAAVGGFGLDQLPNEYDAMGNDLLAPAPNPFEGKVSNMRSLNGPTVPTGQLLRPYPQFSNVANTTPFSGFTLYNSLQLRLQKRFDGGGTIIASYSWTKIISNTDTLLGFLESGSVGSSEVSRA
jgi:hypothetical protein